MSWESDSKPDPDDVDVLRGRLNRALAENEKLRAIERVLRGEGCREQKLEEPEAGPCGVCLRCHYERGLAEGAEQRVKLIEGLEEALEGWADGANYKGDFLRKKHGDDRDIKKWREFLESVKKP